MVMERIAGAPNTEPGKMVSNRDSVNQSERFKCITRSLAGFSEKKSVSRSRDLHIMLKFYLMLKKSH